MIKEIGSYIYDETENGAVILECDKNISGDVEIQESFFGVPVVGIAASLKSDAERSMAAPR